VSRSAHKKLKIDVVDELHSIRERLARESQDKILREAKEVRKKMVKSKSKTKHG
jgi:hypothetical protein